MSCLLHSDYSINTIGSCLGVPDHCGGAPECSNNVTSAFFNTVHLLPKDFRFEHGGTKLASCPRRYLTSSFSGSKRQQLICTKLPLCAKYSTTATTKTYIPSDVVSQLRHLAFLVSGKLAVSISSNLGYPSNSLNVTTIIIRLSCSFAARYKR